MKLLFDRIVREGMERMRWTRAKAEREAKKVLKRVKPAKIERKLEALAEPAESARPTLHTPGKAKLPKNQRKSKRPLTRAEIAKLPPANPPRPAPKTALERIERALSPDDGRRRGGSPTVQGGSPGLGRRR